MDLDLYNENVDYCIYVSRKCREFGIELNEDDFQVIANHYVTELEFDDRYPYGIDDPVVEDDKMLFEIIRDYILEYKIEQRHQKPIKNYSKMIRTFRHTRDLIKEMDEN